MNFVQRIRQLKLDEMGCYHKIFAPDNQKSEEYPFELESDGVVRYYKKEYIEVTDEEFDRLQTGELTAEDFLNPSKNKILKFEERIMTLTMEEVKAILDNTDAFLFKLRASKDLLEYDIQEEVSNTIKFYEEKRKFIHDVYVQKLRALL